jgi:hypothetical protein
MAQVVRGGGQGAVGFNLGFGLIVGLGLVGLGTLGWRRGGSGSPAGAGSG